MDKEIGMGKQRMLEELARINKANLSSRLEYMSRISKMREKGDKGYLKSLPELGLDGFLEMMKGERWPVDLEGAGCSSQLVGLDEVLSRTVDEEMAGRIRHTISMDINRSKHRASVVLCEGLNMSPEDPFADRLLDLWGRWKEVGSSDSARSRLRMEFLRRAIESPENEGKVEISVRAQKAVAKILEVLAESDWTLKE